MNKKVGMYSALLTLLAVLGFALSMILGSSYGSYLSSLFIAWGFVPMICAFAALSKNEVKALSYTSIAFAAIYSVFICVVYFAQITTVSLTQLNEQASAILDYTYLGSLFFNYDLLGYAFMALSTFFTGWTIQAVSKPDKWLKMLLLVHGAFFSVVIMPLLGIFKAGMEGGDMIGFMVLEFWCAYFIPVCLLAYRYFKNQNG